MYRLTPTELFRVAIALFLISATCSTVAIIALLG